MTIEEFEKTHKITSRIELRGNREALTTDNGFTKWQKTRKGIVEPVSDEYYKTILKSRLTKRDRRAKK
jgi:hypothetical protein